jgi:hypothetical protein
MMGAVPMLLLYGGLSAPPPASAVLLGITAVFLLIYASVWFVWRPSRFEVGSEGLSIVWPIRTRVIPRAVIESAKIVTSSEFRREYGYGVRIGAGGLWGGFGLLKTGRETFSMWISRTDRFVIVRVRGARPLLITPEQPERFIERLNRVD